MTEELKTSPLPPVLSLPELVWIGGHPATHDPERRGDRLWVCIRCGARSQFETLRCEPGMIVHLIDPQDILDEPEAFSASPWAEPGAVERSREHWLGKGFVVERKPDGAIGERTHPRFRPCPRCNAQAMSTGQLSVEHLPERFRPAPPPAVRYGGPGLHQGASPLPGRRGSC